MNYSSINRFPGGDWDWEDQEPEGSPYLCDCTCGCEQTVETEGERCPMCAEACPPGRLNGLAE